MSNRVFKKIHGGSDILTSVPVPDSNKLGVKNESSPSESDSAANKAEKETNNKTHGGKKLALNRFELLNSLDTNSFSDTEAKEDDDGESVSHENSSNKTGIVLTVDRKLEKQDSTQSTDSLKRKRKKKRKIRSQKSLDGQTNLPTIQKSGHGVEEDIDAAIEEVNQLLGESATADTKAKPDRKISHHSISKKNLLYVEHKHLNAENEMKKIFGSKVIQSELQEQNHSRRRSRGRTNLISRSWILVNPRNWAAINVAQSGLSMEQVEVVDVIRYFTFAHDKAYQAVQFQFFDAVDSYNPDNLVAIHNLHPYHIDTLIQFSDVCKMGEDNQMAAQLIERALYVFEHAFDASFNVTQANCRLDYRKAENRSFFIALFKHLQFVSQRGCNRTALEFCKLILGLDPKGDPLAALLMIDYYALRCEQYNYLLDFYDEFETSKRLSLLPNFRYSVALASFLKSESSKNDDDSELLRSQADAYLQEALIMFPSLLQELLDKCSVEPDAAVKRCDYFFGVKAQNMPQAVTHLVALYANRSHLLWKSRTIMSWLEANVTQAVQRIDEKDPFVDTCCKRRKKYFNQGTPRNVLRHIILSGIKEVTLRLPPDVTNSPIFGFDPLPPLDAIVTYSRPPRPAPSPSEASGAENQNFLQLFLRSWLPDFNAEEIGGVRNQLGEVVAGQPQLGRRNRERERHRNPDPAPEERQGAGPDRDRPGETNDLRRSVTSLLDAMRDLLSNIHIADIPNDGDVESEDQDDDAIE